MTMNTDALISDLALDARPVRRLARPEMRALVWIAVALATAVAVMAIHGINPKAFAAAVSDPRMLAEIAATALTAVTGVLAAFQSTVPGAGRRWFWLPFASVAEWILLTGSGCAADYARIGPAAFNLRLDTGCFVPGAVIGSVLTVVIVLTLKRGAPLVPRMTLLFAGMAVAATVNLGM